MTLLASVAGVLTACDAPPKAASFTTAVSRYEEGKYEASLAQGQSLAHSANTSEAQEGALIAAMSAFQLGRTDEAERFALQAKGSTEPQVAGGALVLLGNIRLRQHRSIDAADCFERAAVMLPSEDAARARATAAQLTSATRVASAVPAAVQIAVPTTVSVDVTPPPPAPKPTTATSVADRSFTIRAGSYSTQAAAKSRAKSLAKDLQRAKLAPARVELIHTVKGEDLFAVRIGSWPTRAEAEQVLTVIARRDLMVGAVDPD